MLIPEITFYEPKIVKKIWGTETIIANNEKYCGKILCYDKANITSSAHMHYNKSESMMVKRGKFNFYYWTNEGNKMSHRLHIGDCVHIPAGRTHQLESLEENSQIFECSTFHSDEDVYRIEPSQK